ncbi:RHS repeat domain-containing protein, partial [Burkholderia ubonensis]
HAFYYHCDQIGTPLLMTDELGDVVWEASYKAWGEAREVIARASKAAGITPRNLLRFQGQQVDEETGLHYNRYRYYDPASGRFVSKDPIGLAGGINVYQYAANPVSWIDPFGLSSTTDGAGNQVPMNEYGIPNRDQFQPKQNIASPYKRDAACGPNASQTASVQGVPCVVCGTVAPTMIADHKDALVVEYYRSGGNNAAAQSAVTAVQPHCPLCSRRQGGMASAFSKCMKDKLGL